MFQEWLTFVGVLCATVSAFLTAINGTQLFGRLLEWHAETVFRDLAKDEKTSRRRGIVKAMALFDSEHVSPHDWLRSILGLSPVVLTNDDLSINLRASARSKAEIDAALRDWIERPRPLNRSASLWAIGLLLLGGILAAIGTFPLI
ncbi:MAG: hypothetical protein VYB05_21295 [Pseudomonadota bacterium]|nr:hypothetical protein [Pseudomonadota bacterium]